MTAIFEAAEIWDIVSGATVQPAEVDNKKTWIKKDAEARAAILPTLSEVQTFHVYGCQTSKDMWDQLKSLNADTSDLNQTFTLTSYMTFKIEKDESIVDAYLKIQQLARSLKEMNVPISDAMTVTKIITALPDDPYHAFKKSWDSSPDKSMNSLLARLQKEELERKMVKAEPSSSNTKTTQQIAYATKKVATKENKESIADLKKKTTCNNCGKKGHWWKECRAPKKAKNQPYEKKDDQDKKESQERKSNHKPKSSGQPKHKQDQLSNAFMVLKKNERKSKHIWFSDSGATQHITGMKDWYEDYTPFSQGKAVSLTDQHETMAIGVGTVRAEAFMQNKWHPVTINEVLYIPGAVNLFSENVLAQKGYTIIRTKEKAVYYEANGNEGPVAYNDGGSYIMKFRPIHNNSFRSNANTAKLWHERMAHINMQYIKNTFSKEAAIGVDPEELKGDFFCDDCHRGKEPRKPFPINENKPKSKPGEIIHGDLAGKMNPSLGGSLYFLLLKDDATGFRTVYFLKEKSETIKCIKQFVNFIENQTETRVKMFVSDNGTEFVNQSLREFFAEYGIIHKTSAAYCPEANGRIEREMRTLKDTCRAMIKKYKFLWAEAIATSVYVHNRLLDKQSSEITAFEQVFKKKPDLSNLRVFGCKAFTHIPKETRKVWDPKAKPLVFVGYDSNSRKYRLYDPEKKSIIISRNVSFSEKEDMLPDQTQEDDDTTDTSDEAEDQETELEETESGESGNTTTEEDESVPVQRREKIPVVVTTSDGEFEAEIPSQGQSRIRIPTKKYDLRDRTKLKKPDRFQANVANVYDLNEPSTYTEAVESSDSHKWIEAMKNEMNSHKTNGTWEIVKKPAKAKVLDCRWIFRIKKNENGPLFKARLVIKGYKQQQGVDYFETFATVSRYESIRLLLSLAAAKGFKIKQFDIKTAFLYGDLDETIYMKQPEGFQTGDQSWVCLLKKSLYGLKQAPRNWNRKFSEQLAAVNFKQSESDPCVFIGTVKNNAVYLALYVDDGLVLSPSESTIEFILKQIRMNFEIKVTDPNTFVGIELQWDNSSGTLKLSQKEYINSILKKFNMLLSKPASVPMQPNLDLKPYDECEENLPYRELIGSLLFLARVTRPDIAFPVSKLSQFNSCYNEMHWNCAKVILRYLKNTETLGLEYKKGDEFIISGYTDSDYASDKNDRKSTTGLAFFANDALISWTSQKQSIIAVSSTEAEYVALASGAKEALWLRRFANELGYPQVEPTTIYVDNESAIKLAYNPEHHNRTKHIDVRFHFTRSLVEEKKIEICHVPTDKQAADILTKPLMKDKHEKMRKLLGMTDVGESSTTCKANRLSLWTYALTLLMVICLSIPPTSPVTLQNSAPVLWKKNPTPVIDGYYQVNGLMKFISPCEMLTYEIIHKDLLPAAIEQCKIMYDELFLDEMQKMCALKPWTEINHGITPRIVPLVVGAIAVYNLIVVGVAVAGVAVAASNSGKITSLREELLQNRDKLLELEKRVDENSAKIADLQNHFNVLVKKLGYLQDDHDDMKIKAITMSYATSYITGKLMMGKMVLQEAKRQWIKGKVSPALMDFLNFTLPCNNYCPFAIATAEKCGLSEDRSKLFMDFSVPIIDSSLVVLEADPFKLMLRNKNNQICSVKYTGPTNAILSLRNDCIYSLNVKTPVTHDMILPPSKGCQGRTELPDGAKFFHVDSCFDNTTVDARDFVQIKPYYGQLFVYCPESKITIDGKTALCPADVFMLPIKANFSINGIEFVGSQIHVEHRESLDPLFTMKANWHLQPSVNWTSLEIENTDIPEPLSFTPFPVHFYLSTGICVTVILVLVVILLYCCWRDRRTITVKARPTMGESLDMAQVRG